MKLANLLIFIVLYEGKARQKCGGKSKSFSSMQMLCTQKTFRKTTALNGRWLAEFNQFCVL